MFDGQARPRMGVAVRSLGRAMVNLIVDLIRTHMTSLVLVVLIATKG